MADTQQPEHEDQAHKDKPKRRYTLYSLAGAYLLYLVYEMIADIKDGTATNLAFAVISCILFGAAGIAFLVYAWRMTKKQKEAELAELEETRRKEAEAARQAELDAQNDRHFLDDYTAPEENTQDDDSSDERHFLDEGYDPNTDEDLGSEENEEKEQDAART